MASRANPGVQLQAPVQITLAPGHNDTNNINYHHASNGIQYQSTLGVHTPLHTPVRQAYQGHHRSNSDPSQHHLQAPARADALRTASPNVFGTAPEVHFLPSQTMTAPMPFQPVFDSPVHPRPPQHGQYRQPHTQVQSQDYQLSQGPTTYSTPEIQQGNYLGPIYPATPLSQGHQQHSQIHSHAKSQYPYTHRSNTLSTSTTGSGSSPNTPAPPYQATHSGFPTPGLSPLNLHPHSQHNSSPTLAPEYSLSQQKDPLIGLGIGLGMGGMGGMGMGMSQLSSSHSSSSHSLSHDMSLGPMMIEDTFYSPYCS